MSAVHEGKQPCPCRGCTVAYKAGVQAARDEAIALLKEIGVMVEYERDDFDYRPHKEYRKEVWVRFRDALRGDA